MSESKAEAGLKEAEEAVLALRDRGRENGQISLADFVRVASQYVLAAAHKAEQEKSSLGPKKKMQIALSNALGNVMRTELIQACPRMSGLRVGEIKIHGALQTKQADIAEKDSSHGVRFAAELKPVNLAVGRAIWNRFMDIQIFSVNVHIKFPYAITVGVLTIPTFEVSAKGIRKDTSSLIKRVIDRLSRIGSRASQSGEVHQLEAAAVVAFDPELGELSPELPPVGSPLRWENCIKRLAELYESRFPED